MSETNQKYTVTLDDDPIVFRVIEQATGVRTVGFTSAGALVEKASSFAPIAAFIDVHVGADRGIDLIPSLRKKWFYCPIIVITADASDVVVTEALAAGADDFILKPLRPSELLARLQVRLSDSAQKEIKNVIRMGDVLLDMRHRLLRGKESERYISDTEMNLLQVLWSAKGTLVPRATLKTQGWGEISVSDSALARKMHELRRALEETSQTLEIQNRYGEGFALKSKAREEEKMSSKAKPQKQDSIGAKLSMLDSRRLSALSQEIGEDSETFLSEVMEMFLAETPPVFQALHNAFERKDCDDVKRRAHKLKGMSMNIGARLLSEACAKVEQAASEKNLTEMEVLLTRCERLRKGTEVEILSRLKKAA